MSFQIFQTNIREHKCLSSFLSLYGLNKFQINLLIKFIGIKSNTLITVLTVVQINQIKFYLENKESLGFLTDRKRNTILSIKKLIDILCYKGIRHKLHLPVNGQRTHSNAKSCKRNIVYKNTVLTMKNKDSKILSIKKKKNSKLTTVKTTKKIKK